MPVQKYRRGTSTSSPPTLTLYNPSTRAYSAQSVSIPSKSYCDSSASCLPFAPMSGLQKLYSKVMKRSRRHTAMSSNHNGQSNNRKRRPSKHRTPRKLLSSDNEPTRLKPIYRGSSPLKKSDIHLVVDISPESIREYNDEHSWPYSPTLSTTIVDQGCEDQAVHRCSSLIDTDVLNLFPTPPNFHANISSDPRVLEPPVSGSKSPCTSVSTYEFPSPSPEDSLFPSPYFDRLEGDPGRDRWPIPTPRYPRQPACSATAASSRLMPMRSPCSSASSSTHSSSFVYQRREPVTAFSSWVASFPTSPPSHKSTLSLDADVSLKPGPIHRRPIIIRQCCPHDSSVSSPTPVKSPKLAAPRKLAYSLTSGTTASQASHFQPAHRPGESDGVLRGGVRRTRLRSNPTALTTTEAFGPRTNGRPYVPNSNSNVMNHNNRLPIRY
jgi:hypothetical protein